MEAMTIRLGITSPSAGDSPFTVPVMHGRSRVGTVTRRHGTTWIKIGQHILEIDALPETKALDAAQKFADLLTDVTE